MCFLLQIIKEMSAEGLSVHSQRKHKQREAHYAAQLHRTLSCDIRITSATLLFALNGIKRKKKKKKGIGWLVWELFFSLVKRPQLHSRDYCFSFSLSSLFRFFSQSSRKPGVKGPAAPLQLQQPGPGRGICTRTGETDSSAPGTANRLPERP